jgi:hypothetical protein
MKFYVIYNAKKIQEYITIVASLYSRQILTS